MSVSSYKQGAKKSNVKLARYTLIWLITTALLAFGPVFVWQYNMLLTVLAIVFNLLSGAFMIKANVTHLKALDELGQKIFLQSAAITLGVLIIFGVCYELAFYAGKIFAFTPRISHLYFVMGLTFITSTYFGHRNYR